MKKNLLLILLTICLCGYAGARENKTITVINNLNDPVYYLYLAAADDGSWGEDQLGDEILDAGGSITLTVPLSSYSGPYKLMAEDETEKTYRIDGIDLNELETLSISDDDFLPFGGRNPEFRTLSFYNETGEDIYYLYVSSNSSMYWGEDILGDEILTDGSYYSAELPIDSDYPRHDLLAEGESGASYEIPDSNLLVLNEFTFSQENMTEAGDDYEDDYYDDEGYNEVYLEGYREGFRDGWSEAYKQGFSDAMEERE